jgi:hypothetical protein
MEQKFRNLVDIFYREVIKYENHIKALVDNKTIDVADVLYLNSEQFLCYS